MLAAVLGELDSAVTLDDAREETTGADSGQLVRIADQQRLPVRLLDPLEQRPEDPGLGHAGLVDDEQAALGQLGLEEPVEGCRGNAGLVLELLGGDARGGAAEHGHAGRAEGVGEGAGGRGLAGAGKPDDADDPVGAYGDGFEHRPLLGRE